MKGCLLLVLNKCACWSVVVVGGGVFCSELVFVVVVVGPFQIWVIMGASLNIIF